MKPPNFHLLSTDVLDYRDLDLDVDCNCVNCLEFKEDPNTLNKFCKKYNYLLYGIRRYNQIGSIEFPEKTYGQYICDDFLKLKIKKGRKE